MAPRIVNDVSYVMRINHEIHFAWQAQYLLKLEDDSCCSVLFPLRRARRCGLRVVFIASDNPSISFALPCCIRLPKTFVALQCMIFFL